MTNLDIFTAGKRIADNLAVITRNGINDDPNWNIREWDALRQRVAKFFVWAVNHDMQQELVAFVSARINSQSPDGEWNQVLEDIKEHDDVSIY